MDKHYYTDPYCKSISCTVTKVTHTDKATEVLTDRTIFYPEGGGQPGDRGMLGPYSVLDTRKAPDGDSILILDPACPVKQNDALELVLDWAHRYRFMAIHTAQHLLSGLLFTMHSIGTLSVHQGQDYLTIETDRSEIAPGAIESVVLAANRKIRENHSIVYHNMSHSDAEALGMRRSIKVEGDVRIVEIQDTDRIACGGIHVASTSELGLIYCLGHEIIRGHVRLYFNCGEEALRQLLLEHGVISSLDRTFSCKAEEIEGKVATLTEAVSTLRAQNAVLSKKLALAEIRGAVDGDCFCVIRCKEGDDLQGYAQAVEDMEDLAMLVLLPDGARTKWLIALKGRYEKTDFNVLIRPQLAKFNGKGGGRSPLFQGVADCNDEAQLSAFIDGFRSVKEL